MIVKPPLTLTPRELGRPEPPPKAEAEKGPPGGERPQEFSELVRESESGERKIEKPGRESEGERSREAEAVPPQLTKKLSRKSPNAKEPVIQEDEGQVLLPPAIFANQPPVETKSPVLKTEDAPALLAVDVPAPQVVRENAMVNFLNQMQSKFGLAPEKIVDAFTKMSPEALIAPPEDSAQEFLSQLEILPQEMPVAKELYSQMLSKTEALDQVADDQTDLLPLEDHLGETMARPVGPRLKAQRAVDDMNAKLGQMMQAPGEEEPPEPIQENEEMAPLKLESKDAGPLFAAVAAPLTVAAGSSAQSDTPSFRQNPRKDVVREVRESAKVSAKESVKEAFSAPELPPATVDPGAAPLPLGQPPPTFVASPASSVTPNAAGSDRPLSTEDEAANVKALIQQARIAVKNGGGEIEMALKPEGAGKVKLKVSLDEGQISIRMLTENESTKKMLEKGLGELKSSLAEHQLKVENLKVDVGSEINKQMDQNNDQGREQARRFAQDFLGRFRDERGGFRQGLMEGSGYRTSSGTARRPEMEAAPAVRANAGGTGTSKRLNVVA